MLMEEGTQRLRTEPSSRQQPASLRPLSHHRQLVAYAYIPVCFRFFCFFFFFDEFEHIRIDIQSLYRIATNFRENKFLHLNFNLIEQILCFNN